MDELLAQFLIEAPELIQQAGDALLALERAPTDHGPLNQAFRAVHTLKGSVALFDMAPLVEALHASEDILGAVRAGRVLLEADAVDALMALLDRTDGWLADIAEHGRLPASAEGACRDLTARLRGSLGAVPVEKPDPPTTETGWAEALAVEAEAAGPMVAIRYRPDPDCFFRGDDPLALVRQVPGLAMLRLTPAQDWGDLAELDPFRCNLVIAALTTAPLAAVQPLFRLVRDQVALVEIAGRHNPQALAQQPLVSVASDAASRALRVDPARVDALLDIVGELVVAKNGLVHVATAAEQALDGAATHRLILDSKLVFDRLVGTLHQAVMNVRLVPLRRSFERLPRLVRDLAGRLARAVDFVIQGEAIEADKAIVDGLFEPVLHLLRNAVDHGLEDAAERLAAGKAAQGRITLTAARSGDLLVIEVADDGRGIDAQAVRRAAIARGVLTELTIQALPDEAVLDLIFLPGVSTRDQISDLSGRGVGMDAVRSAVERLGGRVGMTSRPGHGATARMTLPLSAVLTKVLTVRLDQELYGVTLDAVLETLRIPAGRILALGAGEAFVLRERTLPLLHLRRLLGWDEALHPPHDVKILIVECDGERVGVAVDAFAERLEVMVRPMAGLLSGLPGLRGTTLLGDGRVLMVLDLAALMR